MPGGRSRLGLGLMQAGGANGTGSVGLRAGRTGKFSPGING